MYTLGNLPQQYMRVITIVYVQSGQWFQCALLFCLTDVNVLWLFGGWSAVCDCGISRSYSLTF